jgi:bla regulator protein BlaR1
MRDFLLLASFGIMLVYLIFRLWIYNMPSFTLNRYFLLSGILLSLFTAAFFVVGFVNLEIVRSVVQLHEITVTAQNAQAQLNTILPTHLNSAHIYMIGVLLLSIRFVRSLLLIFTDFIRNTCERQGRYIIVLLPDNRTPYSFFNLVFIPERD